MFGFYRYGKSCMKVGGILLHHRRQLNDGDLLLLTNTSIDSPTAGTIKTSAKGIEQWNLKTGAVTGYP